MADLNPIIQYRYERSSEAYQEALFLFNEGHYNSTVNRLYYSAFNFRERAEIYNELFEYRQNADYKDLMI